MWSVVTLDWSQLTRPWPKELVCSCISEACRKDARRPHLHEQKETPRAARPKVKWVAPEENWRKNNCDGAYDDRRKIGGRGFVIRDHTGFSLGAGSRWYGLVASPLMAEALAARDGLALALATGSTKVVLELDNLSLVRSLNDLGADRLEVSGLFYEILELGRAFSEFSVVFVRRGANTVAHLCAKTASSTNPLLKWTTDLPLAVLEAVVKDCTPVPD
ncbi:hypothetical protein QOZ80_7BG0589100 [Eleusine coracana subsp. coracana]|nr:hypothetical protein QOZ80_7BG0589100 [Eleusine coracana subsp. coracana]